MIHRESRVQRDQGHPRGKEGLVRLAMSAVSRTGSVRPDSCRGRAPVTRPSSSTPIKSHAGSFDERFARQTTTSIRSSSDRGFHSSPLNSTSSDSQATTSSWRRSGVIKTPPRIPTPSGWRRLSQTPLRCCFALPGSTSCGYCCTLCGAANGQPHRCARSKRSAAFGASECSVMSGFL